MAFQSCYICNDNFNLIKSILFQLVPFKDTIFLYYALQRSDGFNEVWDEILTKLILPKNDCMAFLLQG